MTSRLTRFRAGATRYDHNMRMDERSRLKSIGNENDFQIVCGNMYSAIFMMNSSGYGEQACEGYQVSTHELMAESIAVTFMNAAAERLTGFKYEEISKGAVLLFVIMDQDDERKELTRPALRCSLG